MQPWHFVVLIIVVIVVFGAAKLPDIARNLGKSAKILKSEMRDLTDDQTTGTQTAPPTPLGQTQNPPTAAPAPQSPTQQTLPPEPQQ